ncbi:hypothetical protein TWF694_000919 [Orbilia ellipsospora]|uniref:Endo-1,4-beta-xylanase n=1 Tax=Orbilia ellipsospora TaxID=2528407 RepID=A0AAV9XQH8_9PEZI
MVSFTALTLGLSAISAALAVPAEAPVQKRGDMNFVLGPDHPLALAKRNYTLARRSNTNYVQNYKTGGTVNFSSGTNSFTINWSNPQDFVCGVGWNPGSNLPITHSGSFSVSSGVASLGVYGWTTNPLIEYYVMDWNVGISPGTLKGSFTSDGATYNIYTNTRTNEPSILGTSTFQQYISVRTSGTASGTVTVQNHFSKWASMGLNLGTMNFQVISVESWQGSGSASQSVSNTGGGNTNPPTTTKAGTTPTTTPSNGGGTTGCSAMWGQCGGIGWTGPKCCSAGTCKSSNAYYSQCL